MNIKSIFGAVFIVIIIVILSILGNIERKGYLSELNKINENGDYNVYKGRIKYYSLVFRNNDLYGVYLNTNELPRYIKAVYIHDKGSPFLDIYVTKDTTLSNDINIFYILKIKPKAIVISILLCLIFTALAFIKQIKKALLNYYKLYSIFYAAVLFILLGLFIISCIERKTYIDSFKKIADTRSGYVYKGYVNNNIFLNSGLFNLRNNSVDFIEKPAYIKKGYFIDFCELPAWYDMSNANIFLSNNVLILSNAYSYNAFNYEVPISLGEIYKLDIILKILKVGNGNTIKWDISDSRNYEYINLNTASSDKYVNLSSTVEIKRKNINSKYSKKLHINLPRNFVIEITSIKLSQLDNKLLPKKDNSIVFTSSNILNQNMKNLEIKYKLSFSSNLLIVFAVLTIIFLIVNFIYFKLYIPILNILRISNNNKYINKINILLIILITLGIFARISYMPLWAWDTINYIANGLSLLKYGKVEGLYPGTLFSLINTFLSKLIFNNTQYSSFVYLQIVPIFVTLICTYNILRMFVSKISSICCLLLIFYIYNVYSSISHILIIPYTDSWLLMFSAIVVFLVLRDRIVLAAILIGIAHYYRASQALPVLIFSAVLINNINIKKVIIYFSIIFLSIFIIQNVLNLFFDLGHNDFDNYIVGFKERNILLPFTSLNIKDIFLDIVNVFWAFRISNIPISISLIAALIYIITKKYFDNSILNIKTFIFSLDKLDKIFIFSLLISCSCFIGGLYIQQVFGSRDITLTASGENRYFIYPFLFSAIAAYISLDIITKRFMIFRTIFVIVIFIFSIIISLYTILNMEHYNHYLHFYDYSEDYPEIENDSKYIYVDVLGDGTASYIFKPGKLKYVLKRQYLGGWNSYEDFYTNDNSNIDYLLGSYSLENLNYVTDINGIKFKIFWSNSLDNAYPYILFKKYTNFAE